MPETIDVGAELGRVVAVINGKGGVGKTSITTNVAGQLGLGGLRVLVVDLDVSGNVKLDFGTLGEPGEDDGAGVVDAVWKDQPFHVMQDVRQRVDVIPGGNHLELLGAMARLDSSQDLPGGGVAGSFALKLAEVAEPYDLILLDCPPGNKELQEMALAAARWVLIPTRTDQGSWDGLLKVGPRVKMARRTNPKLDYLGVVIFAHSPQATRLMRHTLEKMEEVGEKVPLFNTFIRHSESAAQDCRSRGQLAHEVARDALSRKSERFEAMKARRRRGDNVIPLPIPTQLSGMANSVAADYAALSAEICDRITRAEQVENSVGVEQ